MSRPQKTPPATGTLYESDYQAWLVHNAASLRAGRVADIAEELEDMGRSEQRALGSHIAVLLHLLKWQFQPEQRSRSRRLSVDDARDAVDELLDDSPSLRRQFPQFVQRKYPSVGPTKQARQSAGYAMPAVGLRSSARSTKYSCPVAQASSRPRMASNSSSQGPPLVR